MFYSRKWTQAFHEWAARYPAPRRFWACGPHFDYSIYAEACRLTDVTQDVFEYWAVRDTRTALDVAGVSKKDAAATIPSDVRKKLVKHHALSDCIEQTYHVWYAQEAAAAAKRTAISGHRGIYGYPPWPVFMFIIGMLLAMLCFVLDAI